MSENLVTVYSNQVKPSLFFFTQTVPHSKYVIILFINTSSLICCPNTKTHCTWNPGLTVEFFPTLM